MCHRTYDKIKQTTSLSQQHNSVARDSWYLSCLSKSLRTTKLVKISITQQGEFLLATDRKTQNKWTSSCDFHVFIYKHTDDSQSVQDALNRPPGLAMSQCPYGSEVMPSGNRKRLSSIADRQVLLSSRVVISYLVDLKVRKLHLVKNKIFKRPQGINSRKCLSLNSRHSWLGCS